MPDPATPAEFEAKAKANAKITTHAFGSVVMELPCPFCAAPGFLVVNVMTIRHALAVPVTCAECGRSIKSTAYGHGEHARFEMVQTGGDDPPPYLRQFFRRSR